MLNCINFGSPSAYRRYYRMLAACDYQLAALYPMSPFPFAAPPLPSTHAATLRRLLQIAVDAAFDRDYHKHQPADIRPM